MPDTMSVMTEQSALASPGVADASLEPVEELQKAFAELASSSARIATSLDRLNSLAQETYNELHATRQALAERE